MAKKKNKEVEIEFIDEAKTEDVVNVSTIDETPVTEQAIDMSKIKVPSDEDIAAFAEVFDKAKRDPGFVVVKHDKVIPKFKFLKMQGGQLPKQGTAKSSGWDVFANIDKPIFLKQFDKVKIPLGLKVIAPDGWWLDLRPRSSTFARKSLHCLYGVIDEDYTGELMFCVQFISPPVLSEVDDESVEQLLEIKPGEAIGQLIPMKRQEMIMEEISEEEFLQEELLKQSRGSKGFGSTG